MEAPCDETDSIAAARFGEGKQFKLHLTDEAKMCLIN
jgi:hypothetical protein